MRISVGSRPLRERVVQAPNGTPEFDDPDDRLIYEFAHGYYQDHRLSDDIYERMRARTLGRQGRRGSCRAHRLLLVRLGDT